MAIATTIIPIFALVFLGWFSQRRGFMPPEFLAPANRLVFYLAIPAMIFRSISRASLKTEFNPLVVLISLICVLAAFAVSWGICWVLRIAQSQRGTFIQSATHGNLGYIGLAVAFYYLGQSGLVRASLVAGFIMILQNFLSVIALQVHGSGVDAKPRYTVIGGKIAGNPVIVSALAGMLFSALNLSMPVVLDRSLQLVSELALPLALLVIGASLSFTLIRRKTLLVIGAGTVKLVLLPLIGLTVFRFLHLPVAEYLPAMILLACPTATITYVMGREMNGDPDLAAAAISVTTLASAVSFSILLHFHG
jgi:predicted permease